MTDFSRWSFPANEYTKAYARLIYDHRPWDWFVTLTFKPSRVPEQLAALKSPVDSEWVGKRISQFSKMSAVCSASPVSMFWSCERHKNGNPHLHGLVKLQQQDLISARYAVKEEWFRRWGIARIFPVWGDGYAVGAYISKYVVKGAAVDYLTYGLDSRPGALARRRRQG